MSRKGTTMELIAPSMAAIDNLCCAYHESDDSFQPAYALIETMVRLFPSHDDFSDVLAKAIVINQLYSTNIRAIKVMATYITRSGITPLLQSGAPEAVALICKGHGINSSKNLQEIGFYSFATKYCHSHYPAAYPIYDSHVSAALCAYAGWDPRFRCHPQELKHYPRFLQRLSDFRSLYQLEAVSHYQLDKFLWVQGRAINEQIRKRRKEQRSAK